MLNGLGMSAEVDAQVTQDITELLSALQACWPEWPDDVQVKYLRLFMEIGLDELEGAESDYFDFISSCVHLAGENMQDARLWALESQVAELQNPRVTLEELLLDAAILLAGELLVVGGFYYALPALLVLLRNRSTAKATREVVDSAISVAQQHLPDLQKLRTEKAKQQAIAFDAGLAALTPGTAKTAEAVQLLATRGAALREIRRIQDAETHTMVAFNTSLDVAKRAMAARDKPSDLAANWRAFLDQPLAGTTVSRAGEQLGSEIDDVIAQAVGAGAGQPNLAFESSSVVGALLASVHRERAVARAQWAQQRLFVRFIDDTKFRESDQILDLLRRIHSARPELAEIHVLDPSVRSALVNAFELVLWLEWFAYAQMIGITVNFEFQNEYQLNVGDIHRGTLVKSVENDLENNTLWNCKGDFYPAVAKLNDELTMYLYDKYARGYFIRHPASVPPLIRTATSTDAPDAPDAAPTFDPVRYDEVARMPRQVYVILTSYDRIRRMDEMRLLVAIYFNQPLERSSAGIAEPVRKVLRQLLGREPDDDLLQRWFDGRPSVPVPKPFSDPLPGEQGPLALTAPVEALLRDAGVEQKWLVGDALSQLDTAITDLDLKTSVYPVTYGVATTSPAPGEPTADDAIREIELAQQGLTDRLAAFRELAAEQSDALSEVATRQQRIDLLTHWTPDRNADLAWHWPATQTEGGDPQA